MKFYKQIISVILVIAITFSLATPVFAVDTGTIIGGMQVASDFGSWLWTATKGTVHTIASIFNDDVCPGSFEQPGYDYHHNFVPQYTQSNGKKGMFYICSNCGKYAGEVLEPAYDDYVATLPATGYDSSGGLLWSPSYSCVGLRSYSSNFAPYYYCSHTSDYFGEIKSNQLSKLTSFSYSCGCTGNGHFQILLKDSSSSASVYCSYFDYYFLGSAPITGTYKMLSSSGGGVSWGLNGSTSGAMSVVKDFAEGDSTFYVQSASIKSSLSFYLGDKYTKFSLLSANCNLPVYSVIPDTALSADTYNVNTRPTSITGGNYGIVGDNGQITKVEDNSTIINETNNTFYNPATGQTVPITGWSYDYSDRSYKVTLESGDTVTVTYGDENITIQEGDTIYNVYYLIDGTGSGNPPSACEHTWTETSTTPATCTMPGSKLFTCSKCQQTKTETVPALGHDWQVKQSVTTEYDDTGQLVQEGYIIYECSRCHEQYKAASGTSPPVNPSDPDASGEGVFSGIFGLLLDFLGFFWKTFKDFTKSGVKAFLDALKDGTSDVFGLLNPFDWSA